MWMNRSSSTQAERGQCCVSKRCRNKLLNLSIGASGGRDTKTYGSVNSKTVISKASNSSGPLHGVQWDCTISFSNIPGSKLRPGREMPKQNRYKGEGTPGTGEVIRINA